MAGFVSSSQAMVLLRESLHRELTVCRLLGAPFSAGRPSEWAALCLSAAQSRGEAVFEAARTRLSGIHTALESTHLATRIAGIDLFLELVGALDLQPPPLWRGRPPRGVEEIQREWARRHAELLLTDSDLANAVFISYSLRDIGDPESRQDRAGLLAKIERDGLEGYSGVLLTAINHQWNDLCNGEALIEMSGDADGQLGVALQAAARCILKLRAIIERDLSIRSAVDRSWSESSMKTPLATVYGKAASVLPSG